MAGRVLSRGCSPAALREALKAVVPELSRCPVTVPVPDPAAKADPLWRSSSAVVGERFIAKFAWSRPTALRVMREIGVLTALAREPELPFLRGLLCRWRVRRAESGSGTFSPGNRQRRWSW